MPTEKLNAFLRLSQGASSHDGKAIRLRIEAEDVAPLDVAIPASQIGDIIQYLAYLAHDAAAKRGPAKTFDPTLNVPPIPATQLALMLGPPGSAILVVRLFDFDLAFELPLAELQRVLPSFAQTVATLATEPKSRN